jgi:hypothetical protein
MFVRQAKTKQPLSRLPRLPFGKPRDDRLFMSPKRESASLSLASMGIVFGLRVRFNLSNKQFLNLSIKIWIDCFALGKIQNAKRLWILLRNF